MTDIVTRLAAALADRYRLERELGVGGMATVYLALDYAHRQNVIHRDIKPENILLHDGSALVADFGIALAVQSAGGQRMTQTGLSLGTPQYMSPEQAMGERTIDARSDIYALGVRASPPSRALAPRPRDRALHAACSRWQRCSRLSPAPRDSDGGERPGATRHLSLHRCGSRSSNPTGQASRRPHIRWTSLRSRGASPSPHGTAPASCAYTCAHLTRYNRNASRVPKGCSNCTSHRTARGLPLPPTASSRGFRPPAGARSFWRTSPTLWTKYKLAESQKVLENGAPATKHAFAKAANDLSARGVIVAICGLSTARIARPVATEGGFTAADVEADFKANLVTPTARVVAAASLTRTARRKRASPIRTSAEYSARPYGCLALQRS